MALYNKVEFTKRRRIHETYLRLYYGASASGRRSLSDLCEGRQPYYHQSGIRRVGDGYADHSFIELYNPGSSAVSLMGWSVQYRSSKGGDHSTAWYVLKLSGTIEAGGYYLIRCGAAAKAPASAYKVPQGNAEWDTVLHNKGLSVALLSTDTQLSDSFSGDITAEGFVLPAGFVDLAAVQGNDKTASQTPPAYEGAYSAIQSKKKAIRRKGFADTDNNSADFEAVDYSKTVSADKGPHAGDAAPEPGYTPAETGIKQYTGFFDEARR